MIVNMEFAIEKVKKALDTPVDLTGNPDLDNNLVLIDLEVDFRGDPVTVVFAREKVVSLYEKAINNNEKTVSIEYEDPSEEEFKEAGYRKDGHFYTRENKLN